MRYKKTHIHCIPVVLVVYVQMMPGLCAAVAAVCLGLLKKTLKIFVSYRGRDSMSLVLLGSDRSHEIVGMF